jgi:peptidoglycan/xylan/chitin deacetylase (PgdA/CDA1 family)
VRSVASQERCLLPHPASAVRSVASPERYLLPHPASVVRSVAAPARHPLPHPATSRSRCAALGLSASLILALGLSLLLPDAAAAQTSPSVPVSSEEISRGDPSRPNAALVFNVGAGYKPATAILDVLADRQLRATFFVMGWWAERHPDELRQIAAAGHEIASHGHSIFDLTQASDAQVRDDLDSADQAISGVTGRTTRPLWSPSAGYRDARVRGIAASLGYRPILWTVDSGDWTPEASSESVYSHVVNGASNGAIIVLHYDSPHSASATAEILPAAIDSLRGAGYHLTTISELLSATS